MKTLTKMMLAAAVAASVSAGANAVAVYGTVTAMQMTQGTTDFLSDPNASFSALTIGGDTVTGLTLTGDMVVYTAGTYLGLSWNLTDGMRQGVNGAGGTFFEGGYLEMTTSTDGINFIHFDTIYGGDYSNFDFLAGQDGQVAPVPSQTTAGLVVDDAGYGTLPGLWDLTYFGAGWNNSVGALYIGGNSAGFFMEGSIAPVPLPAVAWLFGSSLLGLAGIGRWRKAA